MKCAESVLKRIYPKKDRILDDGEAVLKCSSGIMFFFCIPYGLHHIGTVHYLHNVNVS